MCGLLPEVDRIVRWCSVKGGYLRSCQSEIVRLKGNTEVFFGLKSNNLQTLPQSGFDKVVPFRDLLQSKFESQYQQIRQTVSRQNHPPISNVLGNGNIANGKYRSRRHHRAVLVSISRRTDPPTATVSNLRRNLVALLGPRLKVGGRKFGKLAPLKRLSVSKRRGLVS